MKYIDADRLRAEIKRQIRLEELNFAALGSGGQTFCINTLEWVLKRIDSLQQEQPDTATGRVFTNQAPKNIIVENDQWDALLGQFDNGQRVRIILVKEDAE